MSLYHYLNCKFLEEPATKFYYSKKSWGHVIEKWCLFCNFAFFIITIRNIFFIVQLFISRIFIIFGFSLILYGYITGSFAFALPYLCLGSFLVCSFLPNCFAALLNCVKNLKLSLIFLEKEHAYWNIVWKSCL